MEKVAQKLRDEYKVEAKIIQFDFGELNSPEKVQELYAKLDTIDVDVCLLANNAGKAHYNLIHDHSVDICFNMVNVNINASIFMARYYLKKFTERWNREQKRSCVINVASVSALRASAKTSIYAGTKAFNRLFSHGMTKEYSTYVDVHTVLPMSVKTQMNSGRYFGSIFAH